MKLKELEKIIIEKDFDWVEIVEYTEQHDIVIDDFSLPRSNYVNEYIDEEVLDNFPTLQQTELYEQMEEIKEDVAYETINEEVDDYLDKVFRENAGEILYLSFLLIRENIGQDDLLQEGIVNLMESANIYRDDKVSFEKYKTTFVVWSMISYMKNQFNQKKVGIEKFIIEERAKIEEYNKKKNVIKKGEEQNISKRIKDLRKHRDDLMKERKKALEELEKNKLPEYDYLNSKYLLSTKEIEILNMAFGSFGSEKMSYEEIAKEKKLTLVTTRRNIAKAMIKLVGGLNTMQDFLINNIDMG